jgi:hypothetical protein
MTSSTVPVAFRVTLAALVALALLFTVVIGLLAGLVNGRLSWSFIASVPKLLGLLSWEQSLFFALWAGLTGALFALGVGAASMYLRIRLFALSTGVLVPLGLVLLAHFLSRYWPDTTGPLDKPPLTLCLVLYGLLAPWLLGRAASALSRAEVK